MRFDASTADCFVLTYKEGLLSPVAHDLKLRVTKFQIEVSDDLQHLEASFDSSSLRVESAMRNGREAPGVLSDRDKRTIETNIVEEVLQSKKHPEIRYASGSIVRRDNLALIAGTLTICGRSRLLTVEAIHIEDAWRSSTKINQPDFGVKPYTAMLGTLRIRPDITVTTHLHLPTP